ncbi:glycerophosphodiester phosphodiesterase [Heyndrickxia sporothermodurans]
MLIFAHRGASGYSPENTMVSFQKALEQHSDGIELDVRLTKDGVPVVCHDATIKRTSNGKGYIHDFTLEELKTYDFGSWYSDEFKGECIPTLEEVLILLKNRDILLNIEIKNGPIIPDHLEDEILRLIYKYECNEKVIVSSFDHISLKKLNQLDNTIKIGFILHHNLIHLFDYIDNSGIKPYSIHPNHFYTSKEMLINAQKRNIRVFPYTIDDLQLGEYYKNLGVDGMITNKPLAFKQSNVFTSN